MTAGGELFQVHRGILQQSNFNLGVFTFEYGKYMRQQMGTGDGHASYNHTSCPQLGNIRHLLAQQLHGINNRLGLLHKLLPGVCKFY
ncbi:hypothetical protein D3C81_2067250 [compost metagenome]